MRKVSEISENNERSDETRKSEAEGIETRKSEKKSEKTRMSERKDKETRKSQQKKKFKIKPTHVIICVLTVALATTLVIFLTREEPETVIIERPQIDTGGRGTVVTEDNLQEIIDALNSPVEDGYFNVSQTVEWEFENGRAASSNARVRNVEDNTRTVYFDVTLNEDNRLVYTSPYIPLGEMIENFALHENLPAGVYPATVTYFLVDEDNNVVTDLSLGVTITVLN